MVVDWASAGIAPDRYITSHTSVVGGSDGEDHGRRRLVARTMGITIEEIHQSLTLAPSHMKLHLKAIEQTLL